MWDGGLWKEAYSSLSTSQGDDEAGVERGAVERGDGGAGRRLRRLYVPEHPAGGGVVATDEALRARPRPAQREDAGCWVGVAAAIGVVLHAGGINHIVARAVHGVCVAVRPDVATDLEYFSSGQVVHAVHSALPILEHHAGARAPQWDHVPHGLKGLVLPDGAAVCGTQAP